MSSASKSGSVERQNEIKHSPSPRKQEKPKRQDPDSHKIFLSNLNGDCPQKQVQDEVRRLFEKYGQVKRLSLKKHKNGFYYFGFLEYPPGFQAYEAIKALDQHPLLGKNMKVYIYRQIRRQDRQSEGCFYCKRMGHFARQCPQNRDRRRSYSNGRRSRERNDRRRDDRYDRGDRRDRDRDYRDRDRDRNDRRYDREREYERDRHRNEKRRHRSRSYSGSKSSSESSYRRHDRKDKKDKRRRSRS